MRVIRGRWSALSVLVAAGLVASALVLHAWTPGNAEFRSAYVARGEGAVRAATVEVDNATVRAASRASYAGVDCPDQGIYLVLSATYVYTDLGSFPRRGMTIDGVRYLPATCQDDAAHLTPVAGQRTALETVFVVDEATWERVRGGSVSFQVAQFDPWYQSFGDRAVVTVAVPAELADAIDAGRQS